MERIAVESSRIVSIGYDEKELTLEVEFKRSRVYTYKPITSEGYKKLILAPSIGKFFGENIRNNEDIICTEITG